MSTTGVPAAPPRRAVVGYALGSVGTGGFGTLPGLVLAYYLTDTLGVMAGLAGLAVTVPKIWDVLVDPIIGRASDASARRRGSRRAFLLAGAVALPVCFALLFAVPGGLHGWAAALWVVVAFVLATTAFSLFQVPYIALPAELAGTPAARTRLVAPRIAVLAVAILAFGAGGPELREAFGGGRDGYLAMGVITGLVIGIGMVLAAVLTTRRGERAAPAVVPTHRTDGGLVAAVAALRESRPLRLLLLTFVLQALATGAMLGAAQYVATYTLGDESALTVLFAALVAPALLVMPLARRVADRIGKRRALLGSTALFVVATAALVLARPAPGPWVFVCVGLAGVAYAGMQLYPLAMLPDVIAADAAARGKDRAGVIAGVWTSGETAGLALGPALVLGVLALTGFVSRTTPDVVTQPASALWGVVVTFSLVPALLALASLVPLARFALAEAAEGS
ncbi:MFS transporter [Pseudactinotalea suaedae]|uniref:MFS transporter n=1 Tax=Pseudactinotalea suaedae TaxID=1524924 RepID=UPI001F4FCEBC|nr:MFS transporter [Pseudactinotalea suaedae]